MSRTPRRSIVAALALVGAVLVLAGCKPDNAQSAQQPTSHYARSDQSASASPSRSASSSPSASAPAEQPTTAPPPSIAPQHRGKPVTKAVIGSNHQTLRLTYWQPISACGYAWHTHGKAANGKILVWMTYDKAPGGSGRVTCAHITKCATSCDRVMPLKLKHPVDSRPIYDGYTGNRLV